MPQPDRATEPVLHPGDEDRRGVRARALQVLCQADLAHVVDLVAWRHDGADGAVTHHVRAHRGHSVRHPDGTVEVLDGVDPVADQDPASDASHPYAWERLTDALADADRSPDLAVVHTGGHFWPERGGHPGEHGSLNAVQSRAPLLLSGCGVTLSGVTAGHCRTVDVGATLAWLAGGDLEGMEGTPLAEHVQPGARHVVGLLWDGAQPADLLHLAAAGDLPNVARLLARGGALREGAVSAFPSVTLVNHTSALTGVGPGTHGIVNNAFYDRALGEQVVPNSSATWHRAMDWLRPGVRTVFERVPGYTACVNDPVDTGADASTFSLIRALRAAGDAPGGASSLGSWLPSADDDPHATSEFVVADHDYRWASQVDGSGLTQMLGLWGVATPPVLTWWNTTLTDSGHHAGGPTSPIARASMRDADARLGVWLDLLERRGLLDDTVILLTADHGSEAADPTCRGDWLDALTAAGVPFRDEAYGFLYLG